MAANEEQRPAAQDRIGLIQTVQTPLGFFVLVVLIVEAILGVFVFRLDEGSDRAFIIRSMIYLIFALVIIVTGIALLRPSILAGKDQPIETKYSLLIGPPDNLPFDITNINWSHDECFLICGDLKEKITLVRSRVGPTFRVHSPNKVLNELKDEAIVLQLKDMKGNRWEVKSFYLFENLLPLSLVEPKAKIIQDYGEEDQ